MLNVSWIFKYTDNIHGKNDRKVKLKFIYDDKNSRTVKINVMLWNLRLGRDVHVYVNIYTKSHEMYQDL